MTLTFGDMNLTWWPYPNNLCKLSLHGQMQGCLQVDMTLTFGDMTLTNGDLTLTICVASPWPDAGPSVGWPDLDLWRPYPDNLCMLSLHGQMQGRLQVDVLDVHVSLALIDQQFGHLHVIVQGGKMKGGVSIVLLLVHDPMSGYLG